MLRQRIIPSLLLREGRLVKGLRYRDRKDAGLAHTTARAHNAQGADELMIFDIEASRAGRPPDVATIGRVAGECFMPLTVGGGIRSVEDARDVLAAGADKICLTTTARDNPALITELAHLLGSQAIMIGIDIISQQGHLSLYDHRDGSSASGDPFAWMEQAVENGAGEVRLMAVDREGTRQGLDIALLRKARARVNVPIVIEGGAGSLDHIDEAIAAGANGVGLGTMLVFSDNNLVKIQRFLTDRKRNIRH